MGSVPDSRKAEVWVWKLQEAGAEIAESDTCALNLAIKFHKQESFLILIQIGKNRIGIVK